MKHYKPQKIEKLIKELIKREYSRDGMYVVLEKIEYNFEDEYVLVKARYGNEGADGMHSFCNHLKFYVYGKKSYDYIKGIADGLLQSTDLEIGSN